MKKMVWIWVCWFWSFTIYAADFKPASPVVTLMPVVMDNLDLLKLSSQQLDKVRQISRKSFQELEYLNARYHTIKMELRELLESPVDNKSQTTRLADELAGLERKRLMLTIECAEGLKRIFTPSQYQELIALANF